MKLLVKEIKGHSFRLFDVDSKECFRLMKRDAADITVGSLLDADIEASGDLIESITIHNEIVGDSTKSRVEVCISEVGIGDLIDGVPVLNLGRSYAKAGKKYAYAYFK